MLTRGVYQDIHSIVGGSDIVPTAPALQALIKDLETELRNDDFRLQYFYNKRNDSAKALQQARQEAEKANQAT